MQNRRRTRALLGLVTGLAVLGGSLGALPAASAASTASAARPAGLDRGLTTSSHRGVSVVVSGRVGADTQVRTAVERLGGTHLRSLPIIHGLSAIVPSDHLKALASAPGVAAVTKNRAVQFTGGSWDDSVSASPYAWTSQAASAWRTNGVNGAGVSIAVLDTGVSSVNDLNGRLLQGPDLSGEGQNTVDSFGHGTVMAGIAAGDGTANGAGHPLTGVAPGAKIISVKLAGANGATDVSTILAGLTWIAAFKDTYNIRVLNLSWGIPSTQDPTIDPVNFAVETLWHLGVTVVVAAGNSGPNAGTILKPGDDPLAITVGAYDDKGDAVASNDTVPSWSSQGPTAQGRSKPDLVAPGRTIVATRSPGSHIEIANPSALVGTDYIKGSGTSEATAVTSGVAALILQAHPTWTPDQVKRALKTSAAPIAGVPTSLQGSGRIQAQSALSAVPGLPYQQAVIALGTGTLQASRGSMVPTTVQCLGQTVLLTGDLTAWCAPWSSTAWTSTAWTSTAWTSTAWTSTAWTSTAWTSTAWTSTAWTSTAWTSQSYSDGSGTGDGGEADSSPDTPDLFLTAFFGSHPKWNVTLPGEISLNPPGHGLGNS